MTGIFGLYAIPFGKDRVRVKDFSYRKEVDQRGAFFITICNLRLTRVKDFSYVPRPLPSPVIFGRIPDRGHIS
jgi:hypothetical protein